MITNSVVRALGHMEVDKVPIWKFVKFVAAVALKAGHACTFILMLQMPLKKGLSYLLHHPWIKSV